jgi:hypothetical protein
MKQYKILILITRNSGEFDVIFPIIAALKQKYSVKVEMVIVVKDLYKKYVENDFYIYCAKCLDCKISFLWLPNKFDSEFRQLMESASSIGYVLVRLYFNVILLWKLPWLLPKLLSANIYMHENSNQLHSTKPIYWVSRILNRNIYTYFHGHAIPIDTKATRKITYSERVCLLQLHNRSEKYMKQLGFTNQYTIGYPKFFKDWISVVKKYSKSEFEGKEVALIYTRGVHTCYMDEDKYIDLLTSSCRVIRKKMGEVLIVVKPHPSEDIEFIKRVLDMEKVTNYIVSMEHAAVLAENAKIAISLFTSAILDSLSMGVPSIEYYNEAKRYREVEPEGSSFKKLGIYSVDNEQALEGFFDMVLSGCYESPPIIHELSQVKDVGFLENNLK